MAEGSFWRRTPPALFPSTLGALGLSLGWRSAEELGAPGWIADALLVASGGFFAFALICYFAKLSVKPLAVLDDLSPVPGRAAVSAGSMCLMVLAAGLFHATGEEGAALRVWFFGLGLHFLYMLCVIWVLARLPRDQLVVTPVLFLPFVGYIVSPFAGPDLGQYGLSLAIYYYTLVVGGLIMALSFPPYFLKPTPVPARAAAAIGLAPTAVAGISADALGLDWLFIIFLAISIPIAALMAAKARWLTAGGFTPLWGAFTFPAASFAGLTLIAATRWGGAWEALGWAALIAASCIVIPIWALTIRAWALGRLAPATGATTV